MSAEGLIDAVTTEDGAPEDSGVGSSCSSSVSDALDGEGAHSDCDDAFSLPYMQVSHISSICHTFV